MSELKLESKVHCFEGSQVVYSHYSKELKCKMNFSVYLPPNSEDTKIPVLYWLSGLTCTEQNFIQKSGFQRYAADYGVIVVGPDTSPRGCNIEGEDDDWTLGTGAGFYVDAVEPKWKENYRMYSYVTEELPQLVTASFPAKPDKQSIFGHSMGGHGALISYLRNPGKFCSASAFAPICNPMECPWGQNAFTHYLGKNRELWKQYDATWLAKEYSGPHQQILIDQGTEDKFLQDGQLLPQNLVAACLGSKVAVILRKQQKYDHSYYFIASFIEDHINHHMQYLQS